MQINRGNNKEHLFYVAAWPAVRARCAWTKIHPALGPVCILAWSSAFSIRHFGVFGNF